MFNITSLIVLSAVFGCASQLQSGINVYPKHFKVQTPFMLNSRGIIINTYLGRERTHHVLCLDNHSPSWIKSSAVTYNRSFRKSSKLSFKTFTVDGSPIQGDVGICDSVSFADIVFTNVPFYVMPKNPKDNKNDDGVIGIDVMSKGIWKIDFRRSDLTFASSIDSFPELSQAEVFPAAFNAHSITVSVDFGNDNVKTMAIDLGFNGDMLMPLVEFDKISASSSVFTRPGRFGTPAGENIVNNFSIIDTVKINHSWFSTLVTSSKTVKERLIGLDFFKRFDYVLFDFKNKHIYLPKKVW